MSLVRNFTIVTFASCVCIILCSQVEAGTIYVTPCGTGDGSSWSMSKGSIITSINASISGDQIWVASGTYNEAITLKQGVDLYGGFIGNETALEHRYWSVNPSIIDAKGKNTSAVTGANNTILDGFLITGGFSYSGGGVSCISGFSPTIINCSITNNTAYNYGGGVYCCDGSFPTITNCTITNNSAYYSSGGGHGGSWWNGKGGGVYCDGSSPTITNCIITNNSAGGGGGVYNYYSFPKLTNCTITNNSVVLYGGGVCNYSSNPTLTNCILWNPGDELESEAPSNPIVTYSCIEGGYSGIGNISQDPLFIDLTNGDFHLQYSSSCIDSGSPAIDMHDGCLPPGQGTVRNDMGAYGGPGNCAWIDEELVETPTPTNTPSPTATPPPASVGDWQQYQ